MKRTPSANRPTSPPRGRTSVEPYRRAAEDAQYRTSLFLKQVSFSFFFFSFSARAYNILLAPIQTKAAIIHAMVAVHLVVR